MTTATSNGSAQDKAAVGILKTPISAPLEGCTPPAKDPLTKEQEIKYDWLLEQVKKWTEVPSTKGKGGPLTDAERMWLTRECLLRYLRATKWVEKDAEKRLRETLTWRRDFGVADLTWDHISPEQETGKQVILGFDKEGRVCHYLCPGRQNTQPSHRQVEHLVFMLERVLDLLPAQREKLVLLINFKQGKNRSYTAPGIGQAREVLNILQTHYPERLGRALIVNVPWVVQGFFKLITPFIDPLTRDKLKFNEDMSNYVPKEQLWTEISGGALEFEYDHSTYWPALRKMCEERQVEKEKRWTAGGKQIGELEDYLGGKASQGITPPVAATTEVAATATATSTAPVAAPAATAAASEVAPIAVAQESAAPEKPAVEGAKKEESGAVSEKQGDKVEDLKVDELKVAE
ncbi:CRAL/TRIO domain-containing protein [Pyricularia oryzae]|uniref:CRAL/TRIO domain-containing protein n=2 Tax=Pyricularia oryzae TaxID=318829 RepID=A0AA97PIQ0_PYRO3|nr:CRAL/TRIO domain-containing protein [Pyricularia oryzae Y34]KAI7928877.1 CRAL/TRIO domain-containing protein [Pyricularia oryzae]KAI7929558.1 CRAL/TRIO domain-containing protein [Pyricularia oryzae]